MTDKKKKKSLIQAEKELKLAMQKVIEKYKSLQNATPCKCGQNKVYCDYFSSDKRYSYSETVGVLVTDKSEDFIDSFDEVDSNCNESPALFLPDPVKNLDDNTELKAWYAKE